MSLHDIALPTEFHIGERLLSAASGGTMEHINPATGKVTAAFPLAGSTELDEAVSVARNALREWGATPGEQRAAILRRISIELRSEMAELGALTTLEAGIPSAFAGFLAVNSAAWFDYYAGWADRLNGEQIPLPGLFNYTVQEPFGVIALVLTWNAPIGSVGMKAAAALAAGCTIIIKPPEQAPFTSFKFEQICERAGLPRGVLTVLPGAGELGEALVSHPGVDKVSFTGGPETAKHVQAAAARSLTPVLLELGGKSANLVFEDADIDRAIAATAGGITMLSGQVCVAPSRLLVQRSVYDRVVSGIVDNLKTIQVGDPAEPSTMMGPLISENAVARVGNHIKSARSRGDGEWIYGGDRLERDGYFLQPAVFTHVDNASPLAQQELFGPVLAVTPFDTDDEAIELANHTNYGLAAYLHTTNLTRAHTLAARLDAGSISVNGTLPASTPAAPFGGFKQSGYGKEGGLQGILEFCRTKNVCISLS
jgi:acyl-CoA reductase-like NAD-dependent aldehyde dehydrogenase